MKQHLLARDVDHSGVSGTGAVAEIAEFSDGTVAMHWLTDVTSTAIYKNLEELVQIHGHGGSTRVVPFPTVAETRCPSCGGRNPSAASTRDLTSVAQSLVDGDRQSDYGHPLDNFTRIAAVWSVILGVPVSAEQVALCMVGVKIGREVNRHTEDNVTDGIGYFKTLDMVIKERARRAS